MIAGFIVLGGLSAVGAWIIGPTKGLLVASQDGSLPQFFARMNKQEAPIAILLTQAVIVSLLSLVFILMPTVNSSYWFLSVITAQLALIVYIVLFAAALKLHYHKPDVPRHFRVPGKRKGMWIVCVTGALCCFAVILFGFLPPSQVPVGNVFLYELALLAGIFICCSAPHFIYRASKKRSA
jgi:amino acid transporter